MHMWHWLTHHFPSRKARDCAECGLPDETRNALEDLKRRLEEIVRIEARAENPVESEIWGHQRPPRRRPMG